MTARSALYNLIIKLKGGKEAAKEVDRVESSFGELKGSIFSVRSALASIGVGLVVRSLFEAGTEVQRLNRSFVAITGSADKAADEISWLRATTQKLGQEFYNVSPAYSEFLAATKETNLAGRQTREIFNSVLAAATALNKTDVETEGILRALVQMVSKGTVQAEELRGQLGERLPGAFNLAATAMGKTTAELGKMLEKGEVTAEVLLPRLARALDEKYGRAALEAAGDAQQGANLFITAWKDLKAVMSDAGFLENASQGLRDVTAWLKDETTVKAARLLGKAMGEVVSTFTKFFDVAANAPELAERAKRLSEIKDLQADIAAAERRVARDREDLEGWRAKVMGKGVYQKQLEKDLANLDHLKTKLMELQDQVNLPLAATRSTYTPAAQDQSAPPPPGDQPLKPITAKAAAASTIDRTRADVELALAELNSLYKRGQKALEDYFNERRALIDRQYNDEIEALKKAATAETDASKKQALLDEVYTKEAEYKRVLIELTDEQIVKQHELLEAQRDIDALMADLRDRASEQRAGSLQAQFDAELAAMDERHMGELERLEELNASRTAIDEAYRLQKIEKDKLLADQEYRLNQHRLKFAAATAKGISATFNNLYEATGKKNKEFFAIAQAAAYAETVINTAAAIMKAYKDAGPYLGTVYAIWIAAQGAAQLATISAQKLAGGGPVGGTSPHDKADNVPIWATAGEYMQPVAAVKHYGVKVMDAIRRRAIPRAVFDQLTLPAPAGGLSFALAEGGSVPPAPLGDSISVGDIYLSVQATDASSFADNPELVADGVRQAVRLGLLRGTL